MPSLLVTAVVAVSSAGLVASQAQQTTWGTVVMSLHGERTPEIAYAFPYLTPLGAQQAVAAGSAIRTRYVLGPGTSVTNSYPIPGLSVNAIDNTQLYLLAMDDDYIAGSAQAFMQGLYPPIGVAYVDEESILANGTLVQYPLGGYQYPTVDTISPLDFNYVWIAGDNDCNQYSLSANNYINSVDYNLTSIASLPLYQRLVPLLFRNVVPQSFVGYYNAYNLWEYANYQYVHNKTVYEQLNAADMSELRGLASQQEFARNGDLSASGLTQGDRIRTIAGQTYAAHVLSLLGQTIGSQGEAEKISVLFGRYQTFMAFFALSGLSGISDGFKSIPEPGSVMVFELFSNAANVTAFPETKDLWVRFLFRNGSDSSTPLLSYSLFGRGNSAVDMTWNDFVANMNTIKISEIGSWCETCGSLAMYCSQFEDNWTNTTTGSSGNSAATSGSSTGLSPAIAGVLGAVVTIAVLVLLFSLAVLCCGVRFYRNGSKRQSSLGGFKGAEKLASDTDLTVAKPGASGVVIRHERVGSWELSDAAKNDDDSKHDRSLDRVVSTADYSSKHDDDGISVVNPFGDPVKADERV